MTSKTKLQAEGYIVLSESKNWIQVRTQIGESCGKKAFLRYAFNKQTGMKRFISENIKRSGRKYWEVIK